MYEMKLFTSLQYTYQIPITICLLAQLILIPYDF